MTTKELVTAMLEESDRLNAIGVQHDQETEPSWIRARGREDLRLADDIKCLAVRLELRVQ